MTHAFVPFDTIAEWEREHVVIRVSVFVLWWMFHLVPFEKNIILGFIYQVLMEGQPNWSNTQIEYFYNLCIWSHLSLTAMVVICSFIL